MAENRVACAFPCCPCFHACLVTLAHRPLPCPPGFRDCASGGTVSVYHVTQDGWTKVRGDDVTELHYAYYPDPAAHPATANPVL